MTRDEFKKYIKSIGFEQSKDYTLSYIYKEYDIFMWTYAYDLSIDGKQIQTYPFNNLEPLRRFDRSYKLKKILG